MKKYENEDIRWMQISDLHIGSPLYSWTDNTLKERFDYLFRERLKRVQFTLITGDLINRGELNNMKNVEALFEFINILLNYSDKIIITPGNHDYVRDNPRLELLKSWRQDKGKTREESQYAQKLVGDFDALSSLFKKGNWSGKIHCMTRSGVIQVDGLNIVALNTSVFCGQPELDADGLIVRKSDGTPEINDDGLLWICENEFPNISLLDMQFPTIMVGHHPIEMFEDAIQDRIKRLACECGIRHYFCGHMHKMSSVVLDTIHQHTSAGLFKDKYNIPSFSLYTIKKQSNETIEQETYCWENSWKRYEVANSTPPSETDTEMLSNSNELVIEPSDMSDGAIRMIYGKGFFNIYVSKHNPGTLTIPHKHKNLDEITYITKGKVFAYVDQQIKMVDEGNAVKMPKNKFHGFLPASYPCEYITMSVENGKSSSYASDWQDEINRLDEIDRKLVSGEYGLDQYEEIISRLKSSVLEVRWHAQEILNKRLVQEDNEDNAYIREKVGTIIRPAIRSKDTESQFFGLSVAYELGIDISDKEVENLLKTDNYMVTWACAYYILKLKRSYNILPTFNEVMSNITIREITKYYDCCIFSIIHLIIQHDGSMLKKHEKFLAKLQLQTNSLCIEDVMMYFIMWYTSYTYVDEELDYANASDHFKKLFGEDGEHILRGFTNVQDYEERWNQINRCKSEGKLLDAAYGYFENRRTFNMGDSMSETLTKNKIENYLRIIVSEKCNLQCVYCHHEGRVSSLIGSVVKSNPEFSLRDLLIKADELHFKKIKISGGEPLLYPNILEICNEFQDTFEDIGFTTNGTMICDMRSHFDAIGKSKLTFNVTLNSLNKTINSKITGGENLEATLNGIDFLIERGYKVKINSVITSVNFGEIIDLIAFAARERIDIKLLDLFAVEGTPEEFKHVSIAEIKNEIKRKHRLDEADFRKSDDYLVANVMGINVMIPSRIYSIDCQHNCQMYPCAEGIFGIRVYEDYSCAKCFNGTIYRGNLNSLELNVSQIRKELSTMRFSY